MFSKKLDELIEIAKNGKLKERGESLTYQTLGKIEKEKKEYFLKNLNQFKKVSDEYTKLELKHAVDQLEKFAWFQLPFTLDDSTKLFDKFSEVRNAI